MILMKLSPNQYPAIQPTEFFGKPIFNLLKNKENLGIRSRKTPPCLKGIKTSTTTAYLFVSLVERHCPA